MSGAEAEAQRLRRTMWSQSGRPISVLSLDLFDTLLLRRVPYETVVTESGRRLAAALAKRPAAPSEATILQHRASYRAQSNSRPTGQREWRVENWLAELATTHGLPVATVQSLGVELELDVERETTEIDPAIERLAALAAADGLEVVITSDTWHTETFLRQLLAHHGLHFERVFSSGSLGTSKRDGTIFDAICAACGTQPNEMTHIGDSTKSDVMRPALAGWRSTHRPRAKNVAPGVSHCIAHALDVPNASTGDPLFDVAFDQLSPMLICHALATRARARAEDVSLVAYLARDGWLFHRVADAVAATVGDMPERVTLRLSRRSLTLAHPDDLLLRAVGVAGKVGKATIGGRLGGFDLNDDLRRELLDSAGYRERSPATPEALRALSRACEHHADALDAAATEQREMLAEHLMDAVGAQQRWAIVDTGWAGTAQDAIAAAMPESLVFGWYMGVNGFGRPSSAQSRKEGWIWDDLAGREPSSPWQRSAGVIRFWEVLLREPVPSVLRLAREGNDVVIERTRGLDITAAAEDAAARILAGVLAGTEARVGGIRALGAAHSTSQFEAPRASFAAFAAQLSCTPRPEVAKALLSLAYEEGGTTESTTSLDWGGLRSGTTWVPGALAARRLGAVARLSAPLAAKISRARLSKRKT